MRSFKQGTHPPEVKEPTADKPIRIMEPPKQVVIPLHQHTGAPCEPLVERGDEVKVGQQIGESRAFISSPVHASISGRVIRIDTFPHPVGTMVLSVVIESDGRDEVHPEVAPKGDISELSPEQIRAIVREAGIVGLGGAAFPTSVKLTPPEGKPIDSVIINGCECEPYLTADHRVMLERTEDIVYGMKAVMKAVGAERGYIGIEVNKEDAIEVMHQAIAGEEGWEVVPLKVKYPQGAEKVLIKAILNREVPPGGLPLDVGVVVQNVGTTVAIAEAIKTGMPLIRRVITVTGPGVREPQNLLVRIGTTFEDVLNACGGLNEGASMVIMGGPMMGIAQFTLEVPVVKGASGILVLTDREARVYQPGPCISCARCVDTCPMGLLPSIIGTLVEARRFAEAEAYGVLDCFECGCCSYVCPAKRNLIHLVKYAKAEIIARKRRVG